MGNNANINLTVRKVGGGLLRTGIIWMKLICFPVAVHESELCIPATFYRWIAEMVKCWVPYARVSRSE